MGNKCNYFEQSEWLNICVDCGHRLITQGPELPGQCPGCKNWRWLCHLQNPIKRTEPSLVGGCEDTTPEFCPPKTDAVLAKIMMDKNNARPTQSDVKRGRPPVKVPDDLIQKLSSEGLGAIRIAEKLKEQGVIISYKTVQRRLQGVLL